MNLQIQYFFSFFGVLGDDVLLGDIGDTGSSREINTYADDKCSGGQMNSQTTYIEA